MKRLLDRIFWLVCTLGSPCPERTVGSQWCSDRSSILGCPHNRLRLAFSICNAYYSIFVTFRPSDCDWCNLSTSITGQACKWTFRALGYEAEARMTVIYFENLKNIGGKAFNCSSGCFGLPTTQADFVHHAKCTDYPLNPTRLTVGRQIIANIL